MKHMISLFCLLTALALALAAPALSESGYTYFPESEVYVGTWVCEDYELEIAHMYDDDSLYNCVVTQTTGEDTALCWIYDGCSYDEVSQSLTSLENGMKFEGVREGDGLTAQEPMLFTDGAAAFHVEDDGTLTWTDFKETPGENEKVFTRTEEVSIDYRESDLYSPEDMDAAIALIQAEFSTWEGCAMHSIRYATDACAGPENLEWMKELGGEDYAQCIEFLSAFHSPVEGGGAWEADKEYVNWNWWLARVEGGEWKLLTWGY